MAFIQFHFTLVLFLFLSSLGHVYPLGKEFKKCSTIYPEEFKVTIEISAECLLAWAKIVFQTPPKFSDETTIDAAFSIQKRKEGGTALINVFHFLNRNKIGPEDDKSDFTTSTGDPIKPHVVNAMLNE